MLNAEDKGMLNNEVLTTDHSLLTKELVIIMSLPKKFEESQPDPWESLKAFTPARIALGRTGTAVPLRQWLQFKMAHAHARDAVYSSMETTSLIDNLQSTGLPVTELNSQAATRDSYLQRPDLGRQLHPASVELLQQVTIDTCDIAIVIADGLSATAVNHHAAALVQQVVPLLQQKGFRMGPVCLVQQGRVAVGDAIGALLRAKLVLLLIGERPGLSSPDSLGVYITYHPVPGLTDEARNCISNIRPEGLSIPGAVQKILYLVTESLRLQLSGVELKDEQNLIS